MIEYAEDTNYWKTSKSAPSTWIDRAKREICSIGGQILGEAFVMQNGAGAYMIAFELDDDHYKLMWNVLKSKGGDTSAARRQAATALYHDVKAACVKAKFRGARIAFADALVTPEGKTVGELIDGDQLQSLPQMLRAPALSSPDVVEGQVREIT
jgi:hypothetical protein